MTLIHITHMENWAGIVRRGELVPLDALDAATSSRDSGYVCAFSGVSLVDARALRELRGAVAAGKNQVRGSETQSSVSDFVILAIDPDVPGVTWEQYPGEKRELLTPFGPVSQAVHDRIGEYWKTCDAIPLEHLTLVAVT